MSLKQTLAIWTDGGARGNPGPAGIGVRIARVEPVSEDIISIIEELAAISTSIGETTNNQAEYLALLHGLRYLQNYLGQHQAGQAGTALICYTDSELLAYQIQGKYKVKNELLKPLHQEAINLLGQYSNWKIIPIRREKNQVADRLVNEAIDKVKPGES